MDNMIHSYNIDNIDDINSSGTLEGITFYQGTDNNDSLDSNFVKNILDSDTDEEYNNKIIGSVLINNDEINNNIVDIKNNINNNNNVLYSQYFHLSNNYSKYILNEKILLCEIFIVILLHIFLGISNFLFNIITIDGIISSLVFYLESYNNSILSINRLTTIDRYIYYLFILFGYYILNYIFWYRYTNIIKYITCIMVCPNIMCQIYNIYTYKKIRYVIYNGYNNLIQKIVCKQLCKIINIIIINIIGLKDSISYLELIPYYDKFSFGMINKFIVTFIMACIFNHIDKGNMKYLMIVYKNIYMKDKKYKICNDKEYITKIIKDKKWNKLMDVYTLNRLIRMLFDDNNKESLLSKQIVDFIECCSFKIGRIMLCWTIMSITNLQVGILGFFLFLPHTDRPLRYILNTCIFMCLSYVSDEKILILILCEIFYPIMNSKLLTDIVNDTYKSIKRGVISIYHITRLESTILSIYLSYLSFFTYNYIGILSICIVNLIILTRLNNYNHTNSKCISIKKKINRNVLIKEEEIIKNINNTDILLILKDRLKILLKSNPLINIFNPLSVINYKILYKLFLQVFLILIFGYISYFDIKHIILLPFIIQYYIDIMF